MIPVVYDRRERVGRHLLAVPVVFNASGRRRIQRRHCTQGPRTRVHRVRRCREIGCHIGHGTSRSLRAVVADRQQKRFFRRRRRCELRSRGLERRIIESRYRADRDSGPVRVEAASASVQRCKKRLARLRLQVTDCRHYHRNVARGLGILRCYDQVGSTAHRAHRRWIASSPLGRRSSHRRAAVNGARKWMARRTDARYVVTRYRRACDCRAWHRRTRYLLTLHPSTGD